jgi:lipoprotein-anchoring transpeptidase ErfK/SrfK
MVDYYSTLLRAVTAPGAGDAQWRRGIFDRTRQMLSARLRALHPQPSMAEIAAEQSALEEAIERIEQELSWAEQGALAPDARTHDRFGEIGAEPTTEAPDEQWSGRGPIPEPARGSRWVLVALAIVAAALGAGGYVFWSAKGQKPPAAAARGNSTTQPAGPVQVAKASNKTGDNAGDLAPGVDGGASDPEQTYVFRRQPTFYRSVQPAGTIIIDKLQHFLYLTQPNNVALRYGIGLGSACKDLAGLRHISSMAEWPTWQPPPDLLKRTPAALPGGPGNPLGARLLALDDGASQIHGTNAPKTIGYALAFGCIRLANDDIVDLYNRVKVSMPVVVN